MPDAASLDHLPYMDAVIKVCAWCSCEKQLCESGLSAQEHCVTADMAAASAGPEAAPPSQGLENNWMLSC